MKAWVIISMFIIGHQHHLQAQKPVSGPVVYKTISIINEDFMVTNDWGTIPLNKETGEDLNSAVFGGIYFPARPKGSQLIEKRTTVAQGQMDIEIHLDNKTDHTWLLESVTLEVLERHQMPAKHYESGKWSAGTRTMDYNPYFEITDEANSFTDVSADVILKSQTEPSDHNIMLQVATNLPAGSSGVLYEFRFVISLTRAGGNGEIVKILSDKHYFIAAD